MSQPSTARERKTILQLLQDQNTWIAIDDIPNLSKTSMPNIRHHVTNMLKMGLVETGINAGTTDQLIVRITLSGRQALQRGEFISQDRNKNLVLSRDVYDGATKLAEEINVNGISGVLRAVLGRREAFTRWFYSIYAEELSKND